MDTSFDYISGIFDVDTYFIDKNVVVTAGTEFVVSDIVVNDSVVLVNEGLIDSDIEICTGCKLTIYNRGDFYADFSLANNASVVQVVSNEMDLVSINANGGYDVAVQGANGLKLSDVLRVGDGADSVLISDSLIVWDAYDFDRDSLIMSGFMKLEIKDVESVLGRSVVYNIEPGTNVQVLLDRKENPLFSLETYTLNSEFYMTLVRETDYTKIFDNNLGEFINSLRMDSSAGGLLDALDGALSMTDINQIMADSVRIAPIKLMDSVYAINAFNMNDLDNEIGVRGNYVFADDFYSYGVLFYANMIMCDIELGLRLYSNRISAVNFKDEFFGLMFGADAKIRYENNFNFVHGIFGANITSFDISNVYDGTKSVDDPMGSSVYGAFDAGRKFEFYNDLYIAPSVGMTANYMTVLNQNETDYVGRTTIEAGYEFETFGIKYDYAVRANIDTDSGIFIGGRVGALSVIDMIGGYAEVGYINNKIGQGYKISAGLDVRF